MAKMLIVSPEFKCSQEILTIVAMLSGMFSSHLKSGIYQSYVSH